MLEGTAQYEAQLQDDFERAYAAHPELFRESLLYARDALATLLIDTWARLTPDYFSYTDVHHAMLQADRDVFHGLYRDIINVNFKWRHIGSARVGPQLPKDKDDDPVPGGHKDKKHKIDGLNENLVSLEDRGNPANGVLTPGARVRSSYAERYRQARQDK
jgi:hypothetical protein